MLNSLHFSKIWSVVDLPDWNPAGELILFIQLLDELGHFIEKKVAKKSSSVYHTARRAVRCLS
jgi:hypothetical protein